jgi:hypothetical protein
MLVLKKKVKILDISEKYGKCVSYFGAEGKYIMISFEKRKFVFLRIEKEALNKKDVISFKNIEKIWLKDGEKIKEDLEKKMLNKKQVLFLGGIDTKFYWEDLRNRFYLIILNNVFVFEEKGQIITSFSFELNYPEEKIVCIVVDKNFKLWSFTNKLQNNIFLMDKEYKLEKLISLRYENTEVYHTKGIAGEGNEVYFIQSNPILIYKIISVSEEITKVEYKNIIIEGIPEGNKRNIILTGAIFKKPKVLCLLQGHFNNTSQYNLLFISPSLSFFTYEKILEPKISYSISSIDEGRHLFVLFFRPPSQFELFEFEIIENL